MAVAVAATAAVELALSWFVQTAELYERWLRALQSSTSHRALVTCRALRVLLVLLGPSGGEKRIFVAHALSERGGEPVSCLRFPTLLEKCHVAVAILGRGKKVAS